MSMNIIHSIVIIILWEVFRKYYLYQPKEHKEIISLIKCFYKDSFGEVCSCDPGFAIKLKTLIINFHMLFGKLPLFIKVLLRSSYQKLNIKDPKIQKLLIKELKEDIKQGLLKKKEDEQKLDKIIQDALNDK